MDNNATVSEKLTRIENAVDRIRVATDTENQVIENVATFVEGHIEKPEAEDNDVIFVDYDGKRLYSYSASDFANLSALPANPTHEGLTSQGWGWTLEQAKEYVAMYGMLVLGQFYTTTDGAVRIYVHISDDAKSVKSKFYACTSGYGNGSATIDWGDGTTPDTYNSVGYLNPVSSLTNEAAHTYATGGDYVIKITPDSGNSVYFTGNLESGTYLLYAATSDQNKIVRDGITKIEFCSDSNLKDYGVYGLNNLQYIVSHTELGNYGSSYVIGRNSSLRCIGTRNSLCSFGGSYVLGYNRDARYIYFPYINYTGSYELQTGAFAECLKLEKICLPQRSSDAQLPLYMFYNCSNLKRIGITANITSTGNACFSGCNSLLYLKFPGDITLIGAQCIYGVGSLRVLDLSNCTQVCELRQADSISGAPKSLLKIIVPDALYEDWKVAQYWSTYAANIVKASEA